MASLAWTRSCCASLPGLRNRFSQCLQMGPVAPVAGVAPASPAGTSAALLEAVASGGPSSGCCRATRLAAGRRGMTLAGSVVGWAAAFPGPLFALGSDPCALGSAGDRLRGHLPSAPIVRGRFEGVMALADSRDLAFHLTQCEVWGEGGGVADAERALPARRQWSGESVQVWLSIPLVLLRRRTYPLPSTNRKKCS